MCRKAWWHYEIATVDNTHLLAIFDAPVPEFIPGSDLLRLTPASVYAHTYCLDEATWKAAIAPITETVDIGPPVGCKPGQVAGASAKPPHAQHHGAHYPQKPYGQREQPAYGYPQFPSPVIGNGWDYGNFNG